MFFSNSWNSTFLLLYYSSRKNATVTVFIWDDREYPPVPFEYKTISERYLVDFQNSTYKSWHKFSLAYLTEPNLLNITYLT